MRSSTSTCVFRNSPQISDLKEAQEKEAAGANTFAEMRSAKTAAIEASEKMEEQKEAEKAETDNLVAEAKELPWSG